MGIQHILIRPLVTEKTAGGLGTDRTYAFEVGLAANKLQVRKAIEEFYGVDVATVRTIIVRGKNKRWGRHVGKRSNWKKAYVTVAEGQSLPVFDAGV
ncbi:MAG: 50S ribosomal protein L23 [Deltaproteobacteria bacterium]|nr:MAG: 50S ribosomal protein L23 [Deltaproteobacteria bacterium]